MPKMIGNWIEGATTIDDNAVADASRVRLRYSQAVLLDASDVIASLDTTDSGSRRSLAKRWYRWFATPAAILACTRATRRMRDVAVLAQIAPVARFFAAVAKAARCEAEHPVRNLGRCIVSAACCVRTMAMVAELGMTERVCDQRRPWADRRADQDVALDAAERAGIDRKAAMACLYRAESCRGSRPMDPAPWIHDLIIYTERSDGAYRTDAEHAAHESSQSTKRARFLVS